MTGLAFAPSTFSVDLRMPTETPNPWWRGDLVVVLNAPSAGIYSAQVGGQSLSSAPLGAWSTISFSVAGHLATQLTQEIEDLTVDVILNVPHGDAVYLLDNARFE